MIIAKSLGLNNTRRNFGAGQPYEVPQASGNRYLQNCMFDTPSNVSNMCHLRLLQLPLLGEVMHVLRLRCWYTATVGFCYLSRSDYCNLFGIRLWRLDVEIIVLDYSGPASDWVWVADTKTITPGPGINVPARIPFIRLATFRCHQV